MNRLYAPWRSLYAKSVHEGRSDHAAKNQCDFCIQLAANQDDRYFILKRFKQSFVCLNLYPYNAGHLMVLPNEHRANLYEISKEARTEIMEISCASTSILQEVLESEGVNIGLNMGKAAGAGIPSHLHMHVLPRWSGDTNFLPTLANTKLISFDLQEIFQKLKPAFEKLTL